MAKTHKPLPVAGYTAQGNEKIALVNKAKEVEERALRVLDDLEQRGDTDLRMVALARTNLQTAFMWANRAVFQPTRVRLPEDA